MKKGKIRIDTLKLDKMNENSRQYNDHIERMNAIYKLKIEVER